MGAKGRLILGTPKGCLFKSSARLWPPCVFLPGKYYTFSCWRVKSDSVFTGIKWGGHKSMTQENPKMPMKENAPELEFRIGRSIFNIHRRFSATSVLLWKVSNRGQSNSCHRYSWEF